jgi:hypothetical protein
VFPNGNTMGHMGDEVTPIAGAALPAIGFDKLGLTAVLVNPIGDAIGAIAAARLCNEGRQTARGQRRAGSH